jgi:hypothetical protein
MRDATSIGQLMCTALRNRSAHKGCPQPAWQSREKQSRCSAFWLIKKAVVVDQMSGERQIPPDLVVKYQGIDIAGIISSPISRRNSAQRSYRNRKTRFERPSPSEAHWSTTKSGGMCDFLYRIVWLLPGQPTRWCGIGPANAERSGVGHRHPVQPQAQGHRR